jgi:translation initiation factor IF-1
MAKEEGIKLDATALECLSNGRYRVKLDNGVEAICTIKGKLRKHFIRVLPDDRIQVDLCPYDLTRGFITYRYK